MMYTAAAIAGIGVVLVLLLLLVRWKWRSNKSEPECPPCLPLQTIHRLCPHHNVVQRYEVEQKDSLDEHLDVLTRKLAEKDNVVRHLEIKRKDSVDERLDVLTWKLAEQEGRLRISKSKIRETQNEIDNLHAIDQNVRFKYREIMDSLKSDLIGNEKECKKLQEQIEWVSRRRAELKDEVRHGQRLYGEAAAELATNLAEMQRGRTDHHVIEKPYEGSSLSLRHRKEPQLPRGSVGSILNKSPPQHSCSPTSQPTCKYKHSADSDQIVP